MRRRITFTMVGVVAAALIVATAGTALLLRYQARRDTTADLRRQAATIASRVEDVQRPQILTALTVSLRLEELRLVCFGPACRPAAQQALPPGVGRADLDLDRLRAGETVSGMRGPLVFAAAAVGTQGANPNLLVLVLTRRVETRIPGGAWFLIVAGLTLAAAAAVAANLSRRLTGPLREARAATHRIAAGDLAARIPVDPQDGEELAGLAASINSMAASLERSRGLERQFLLSVSHDLRTPLTSIRGFAEALAEGRTPDPAHAANVILSESRRLERLVQDLLELARLDARRFSLDLRATDVAEVVAETAEGFRPAAEQAGVALEVSVGANGDGDGHRDGRRVPPAAADPDRLSQVVANLVENALKYARGSISVGTGPGGEIWVADDGPGIGADELAHVFEPFYQAPRAASRDIGTGLGLAIVHELVEAMGGEVRAESPADDGGTGTRVVVSLRPWSPP